ncbi:sulfatase [Carboxylicivirga sp. M1479]|uniref:sulfatase n=1 Tax=Carboxylicivirga sp. M1479 TaxID=2594476 RepID=UPI0011779D98|nr:sulfatase [Carboxylicivirga sp. M1479]TRX60464.1 sulfatase [Carboxylicivirga sp. M1479]
MIYRLSWLVLLCILFGCKSKIAELEECPNIVVFLVDDMGLMDTSVPFLTDSNGLPKKEALNDYYRTPNMERLAKQGIRFSNFYAHSVCSPSRIALLTGQNSARHRATNYIDPKFNNKGKYGPAEWNWSGPDANALTLPKLLQQAGYKTIHIGKAHFGPVASYAENPINLGFDVNIGGNSFGRPGSYYGEDGYGHINGARNRAVPGLKKYHGTDTFLTEALTLEAKAEITKAKSEGKPFFLHMAHYAVHAPFQSDPRFAANYKTSGKSEKAKAYATLVEGMDKSLGDIINHIKDLGLGKNTLVLFIGDNGSDAPIKKENGYSSSAPLKGKKAMCWEGGVRVPFIAAWLDQSHESSWQKEYQIVPNSIQQQIGKITDIFPTICNIAGARIPKHHIIDGDDLKIQLGGQINANRSLTFLNHFPHKHRSSYFTSLIKGDWKIIYHYPIDNKDFYELFDLENDPFETDNLAKDNTSKLYEMALELQNELRKKEALHPEITGEVINIRLPFKE